MVSRFFACAGVGGFFTLAASILAIFAHIGQISDNIVPRNIRMVSINTSGVGQASGAGTSVYGSGARNSPNTGLRQYYQWGLWNYCEKNDEGGVPDFCSGTSWANSFQPLPAILYDVPSASQTQVANVLPSSTFTDTDYLSSYSKAAFYLLIIGTILGGLALIVGFLAHRFAYLLAALFCLLGFLCTAVGCVIWTVIISKIRSGINDGGSGLYVSYGDGLWIYWAASGCLLAAILPNIFSCIAGRDRDYYY